MNNSINTGQERSSVQHWDDVYKNVQRFKSLYLYNQQLLDVITRSLGNKLKDKKILEVGCGKGKESLELSRAGAEVTGIDFSHNAISSLKNIIEATSSKMTALQCDARNLPFQGNSFDLVFSQGVIEHFTNPQPLLREQFRVLKPGGIIVVEVPNKYNIYTIYKHVMMFLRKWPPGWETEFSPKQLTKTIIEAGFEPKGIVGWDTFSLRAIRKISKRFRIAEKPEKLWQKQLRRKVEGKPIITWLSLSLTIIAQKPL